MSCHHKPPQSEAPQESSMPKFWRSFEELAGDPAFEERLVREFPRLASVWEQSPTDRRRFLQLMGASVALAGATGCNHSPSEQIMPYVRQPDRITPGLPNYFATAMPNSDGAIGLVATSNMGRPTKLEGNKLHSASLGATDAFAQASLLTMYDPDRSQTVKHLGIIATWGDFVGAIRGALPAGGDGAGLRILSSPVTSPTLARQREALLAALPQARWHQFEPVSNDSARQAAQLAFGADLAPIYDFTNADVVVAIDSDFLSRGGASVRYSHDFMSRRGVESETQYPGLGPNRLYSIESTYTPTGAAADNRLPLSPSQSEQFLRALARKLEIAGALPADLPGGVDVKWLDAVASDLQSKRGRSIVIAGDHLPASAHVLAYAINAELGNVGPTVNYIESIAAGGEDSAASMRELTDALNGGQVQALIILDGNPVYDAPVDLNFAQAIRKTPLAVHLSLFEDETSELCHWHIPAAHYLESWSDARGYDGTAAIVQPMIAPLYNGKTSHEVVAAIADPTIESSYNLVRATWQAALGGGFEEGWHKALADGVIADTKFKTQTATVQGDAVANLPAIPAVAGNLAFEMVLLPDPTIGDGRYANNGWLQEAPKPMSKLTWDNAVLIGKADADELNLKTGDIVRIESGGQEVKAPVCIMPGHGPGSITCHFGYGRTLAGKIGSKIGFDAYKFRTSHGGYIARDAELKKTGEKMALAITQTHHEIDGRNIVHSTTVEEFKKDPQGILPDAVRGPFASLLPLWEDYDKENFAWGMAIDLTKCSGCNTCVMACQAENNIPIVGKEQVLNNREMAWIRMDLYYSGDPESPEAIHQPMLCQHCEKAPCEVVCPVAATTHSDEGLNEMTYNRCVGTRYCSNNCPYKVRRFNFFQYSDTTTPVLQLMRNPEVTVRNRGVMEKCTYCVQRINHARIDAKKEGVEKGEKPSLVDGTLQTACQQACPSQAIVFGNINDSESRVAKLKQDARNYGALSELGVRPRTTYLVRLRNPNPALA
ncbi:TAT-variant-translocated molybdopterin oxidoreductase [Lacipirellula sp.]|uniref:TAT-variant-translocated molybdopterin oxidoreductase n=1 Tax=Lacipirellula sp. TaxID=2691419 RepID=UPI003D0BB1AC